MLRWLGCSSCSPCYLVGMNIDSHRSGPCKGSFRRKKKDQENPAFLVAWLRLNNRRRSQECGSRKLVRSSPYNMVTFSLSLALKFVMAGVLIPGLDVGLCALMAALGIAAAKCCPATKRKSKPTRRRYSASRYLALAGSELRCSKTSPIDGWTVILIRMPPAR